MREKTIRSPRSERILIVDDEPWIADVIAEQLAQEGFRTNTSTDSSEVINVLTTSPHDLVILDIHMPEPNGLELLKSIQERQPLLPVLMLTAFGDAKTATLAMQEGASDYIVKPHSRAQLIMRVERALERGQMLRERAHARELLEQRVHKQTRKLHEQSKQLAHMLDRILVTYQATLKALEAALDVRDQSASPPEWGRHCRRVAKLAVRLAKRMGVSGDDLVALEHGALLHDIGKLGIPDVILMKPGPLNDQEWRIMQRHPEIGCQIVGHIDFLKDALPIIRYHHEHYDGSGYPSGLKGEEIPLLARIFSVVDSFDAQISRAHGAGHNAVLSAQQALETLRADRGKLFDRRVIDEFVKMIAETQPHASRTRSASRDFSAQGCTGAANHSCPPGEEPSPSGGHAS